MIPKRKKLGSFWEPEKKGTINPKQNIPAILINIHWFIERREVSIPWLTAIILTGCLAIFMMGGALFATLSNYRNETFILSEEQKQTTISPLPATSSSVLDDRILPNKIEKAPIQNVINFAPLSTQQIKGQQIIANQPFQLAVLNLYQPVDKKFKYPAYSALNIQPTNYQSSDNNTILQNSALNQNDMADDNSLKITTTSLPKAQNIPTRGILEEELLNILNQPPEKQIKAEGQEKNTYDTIPHVRITNENVSIAVSSSGSTTSNNYNFYETLIPIRRSQSLTEIFQENKYTSANAKKALVALTQIHGTNSLPNGTILRVALENAPNEAQRIARISLYNGTTHQLTVALNATGQYVRAQAPETSMQFLSQLTNLTKNINQSTPAPRKITLYDAIYQHALSNNLSLQSIGPVIAALSEVTDLNQFIHDGDQIKLFYQIPAKLRKEQLEGKSIPPFQTDILYFETRLEDKTHQYYLYRFANNSTRYYDQNNKSIGVSILRKPVQNARFSSPFGARRHPILGYIRMHTGVDWAARIGSPIMAAGDGVVIKMARASGYGNHTEIRHSNGYITTYSHQARFAKGLKVGDHVKQRQIIGFVGNTGLSTGPHLHYEIVVNGSKVDPLRVRLPDNHPLKEKDLNTFVKEKNQINNILHRTI